MLKMFEAKGEISHIPMDPVLVAPIPDKCIKSPKQLALDFIKALSHRLS